MRYAQLAHNVRHPTSGNSVAEVLHSFGRKDRLDREALARLWARSRVISAPRSPLTMARACRCCPPGAWVAPGRSMGCGDGSGSTRRWPSSPLAAASTGRVERVLFALVANRALEPSSKLAATRWVAERAFVAGLGEVSDVACYRAMDWLLAIEPDLATAVYWSVADLLNLEVDLLFFGTTSTYFETDTADAPEGDATVGFRAFGKSKDHRPDLPKVVIGMAVTRTGIPIRVWCWPGNTNDSALIRQVNDDLRAWRPGRGEVWVADRGFSSEQNRRYLQRGGGNYIVGEKLRGDQAEAKAALSRQGRYRRVAGNLEVKEVVIDDGVMRERFVICPNPDEARRDALVRDRLVDQLHEAIAGTDHLGATERAALAKAQPAGLRWFLRTTPTGLLRVDRAKVAAEANLDGKFLLRTSDPTLSAEDIALGYKQLLEVERGWRDMKSTLELRPVFHRLEDRIRAHVILCWLALLLIRLAETAAGDTWRNLRHELDHCHLLELAGSTRRVLQRTELTDHQTNIFRALQVPEPPRFVELTPT